MFCTQVVGRLTFAFLIWIIDVHKNSKYFKPFLTFGVNPLFAYVFAELCGSIFSGLLKFPYNGNLVSLGVLCLIIFSRQLWEK